jgi:hypothetical protein
MQRRVTQAGATVAAVPALDAEPRQGIAVPISAILIAAALYAAAAVARAQLARGSTIAFVVFVALVTDSATLVATVKIGWAGQIFPTLPQAAIGK